MTAPSDRASGSPREPLYAPESHETPSAGTERRPGVLSGPQTGARSLGDGTSAPGDFDGCNSACRRAGKHTLRWGGCEHAPERKPTVSLSCVYVDTDGRPSIGFDTYTVQQLADLIEPALITPEAGFALPYDEDYGRELALAAAKAIFHRNDPTPNQP